MKEELEYDACSKVSTDAVVSKKQQEGRFLWFAAEPTAWPAPVPEISFDLSDQKLTPPSAFLVLW